MAGVTLPSPSDPSPTQAFGNVRHAVINWYSAGILAAIVMPTRVPPRSGLKGTWLGRHVVTFRMRDGSNVRCRLHDAGDPISVYIDRDYQRMPLPWSSFRSIVDVGSTVGSFTLWAARQSSDSRFVAVEPNPDVFPFLLENIRLNHLTERVTTVHAALGSSPGVAAVADDRLYSTQLRFVPAPTEVGSSVRLLSLEGLFAETNVGHCDLLKIDCEGCEYDILLETPDSVLERVSTIVCEYHPIEQHEPAQLVARLIGAGYQVAIDHTEVGFIVATRER